MSVIVEYLQSLNPAYVISAKPSYDLIEIEVPPAQIIEVISALMGCPSHPFRFLTDLCGIHLLDPINQLGVVYHLHSLETNTRLRIKTFGDEIPSITPLFAAANWMERETYDFYGIQFRGHPHLQRILNMEDMTVFPMRKDYPLEDATRDDKDDRMFGR
jgi:NADH-quinone oxidoreductase subunit C